MGASAIVQILREDSPAEAFTLRVGGYSLPFDLIERAVDELIAGRLQSVWDRVSGDGLEPTGHYLCWAESLLVVDVPRRILPGICRASRSARHVWRTA